MTQPVLFLGHGSPMNIIETNTYTKFLKNLAHRLEKPKAIIVISAHRVSHGSYITGAANPEQIYDFGGFPEALYKYQYRPLGDPELAQRVSDILGISIHSERGIDHAARAVLCHMYPDQTIPVLEISLDVNKTFEEHMQLASKLTQLREENILIIGSGNIIHNLGDISRETESLPFGRAEEMDQRFATQIETYNINHLTHYYEHLPHARHAIPTTEHYIPLLYVLAMKQDSDNIQTIFEGIQNGSISMRSIQIG